MSGDDRRMRLLLGALILLAPGLSVAAVLRASLGASLADCVPVWSDEVHYWNEVAAFARAGFAGGYCTNDERTAPLSAVHFGPHGPGFPVVYGSLARVLGWHPWSGPAFSIGLLLAATAVWLGAVRLRVWGLGAALLLVGSYWPCLLYLPTTMQEGLHAAVSFVLAAAGHQVLGGRPLRPALLLGLFGLVAVAALVRLTWCVVLIPLAVCGPGEASGRVRAAWGALAAAITVSIVRVLGLISAPYPNFLSSLVRLGLASPREGGALLAGRVSESLVHFFSPTAGQPLEVLLRYEVAALLALCIVVVVRVRVRGLPAAEARPFLFAGLNLGVVTAAVVVFYDVADWRDYRVLAPHLLLSLLVLLTAAGPRWVAAFAVANLLAVPAFVIQFEATHGGRVRSHSAAVSQMREAFAQAAVDYDPRASAWENTVLAWGPADAPAYTVVGVPPGIGVTGVLDLLDLRMPPRSKYLLTTPDRVRVLVNRGRFRVRVLAPTPLGLLYQNLGRAPRGDAGAVERTPGNFREAVPRPDSAGL